MSFSVAKLCKLAVSAFLALPLLLLSNPAQAQHPRLWLKETDLPRLRSWATDNNPVYRDGLLAVATRAKAAMDAGDVPQRDCGSTEYETYPAEMYAELFAFMSLIDNDANNRSDYASRARTLLMGIINQAAQGPASEENYTCAENQSTGYPAYRSPRFFTEDSNRARWHGEAFPLVVDWIYPSLTAADKTAIRGVFLRWSQEIVERGYHRPEPLDVLNSSELTSDPSVLRWAGNNYFTAHMRNLGMMALSFDAADDANNQLRNYLNNATGAWLYMFDYLSRNDSRGGLLPEGYEYSPQTASYAIQFLLALHTAGADTCGQHCKMGANPFWDDFLSSFYHSLSPASITDPDLGQAHQPFWYGDGSRYRASDFISAFGALGIYDDLNSNASRLNSLRWAQKNMVPGGTGSFLNRVSNPDDFREAILYFMLYDPAAAEASDPRSNLPLDYYASGMNMFLSRTSWQTDATWFSYSLPWNLIDHQQANANHFEWYRKGEWLTKARNGYPDIAEGIASTEFQNALTLQNDQPSRDATDWRIDLWQRGSQWNLVNNGDPSLLASSSNSSYLYTQGDATNAYNSTNESSTDIVHASRAILWLKPDAVVVFDRAQSKTAGRFKRWWLQLPNSASINGQTASVSTAGGQQLIIDSLLPSNAVLNAVDTSDAHVDDTAASGNPMRVRLRIDAPDNPSTVQFLQVLQAADGGQSVLRPSLIQNATKDWSGAQIADTVVMFPHSVNLTFSSLSYTSSASKHIITGLTPNATYQVSMNGNILSLNLNSSGNISTDEGGVLRYPAVVEPRLQVSLSGTGTGRVESSPVGIACGTDCSQRYANNTSVVLSASAAPGNVFGGWSGDCFGTATCTVSLSQARNVTAIFTSSANTGTPPGAPSLSRIQPNGSAIDVYFSAPANSGSSAISSYLASCSASGLTSVSNSGSSSPLRLSPLTAEANYSCTVTARNSAGSSSASNSVSVLVHASGDNAAISLPGTRSAYTISNGVAGRTVSDANGNSFSMGSLQRLHFSDSSLAFDTAGNAGMVYRLYQAAFDRVPDIGGVGFHIATIEKYGLSLDGVAQNFINSAEFANTYGNLNNAQFVNQMYLNVLHRAADAGGLAFWTNILDTGAGTRSGVLTGFSESNENIGAVAPAIANGISFVPYEN